MLAERADEPLAAADRFGVLDAVRGFSLLGILLMNIEYFSRPIQGMLLGAEPALQGADRTAAWFVVVFVQGKFWVQFSLLFGIGFALMLERCERIGRDFHTRYVRRLLTLMFFGLAHATLIWAGDILLPYSLAGFGLLLVFARTSAAQLWKWGLALYFAPMLLSWAMAALMAATAALPGGGEILRESLDAATRAAQLEYAVAEWVYAEGSYGETVIQRLVDLQMQLQMLMGLLPALLGIFALGAWLVRAGVLREPEAHRRRLHALLWLGGPAGVVLALVSAPHLMQASQLDPSLDLAGFSTLMWVASLLIAFAMFSAFVLAQRGPLAPVAAVFGPAGRMALSNYLLQSLVCSLLFYGYGFGWWGELTRRELLGLAVGLFVLQLALSHAWLALFRFGPAEWVWRSVTYLKRQPLRR